MNASFNEVTTSDAAKTLKVSYAAVYGWCSKGVVNSTNVGGGRQYARYMLTVKEVDHIKQELKKIGLRNFTKLYDKNWDVSKDIPEEVVEPEEIAESIDPITPITESEAAPVEIVEPVDEDIPVRAKKIDLNEVATTISYMQDIKDRLEILAKEKSQLLEEIEDIEAETNQLTNEYDQLKTEIIGSL